MAKLSSAELAAREKFIQGMKKNKRKLIKKYGADAEKVMYGSSTTKAKKLAEQDMEQNKLREMVKAALMQPISEKTAKPDFLDLDKDGDKEESMKKAAQDAKTANEDLDLGHQDNEPHMIKAELYRIGKYAMELYQMVDEFEGKGEVDFPAWWQSKITTSANNMVSAKHYLDFETKEPQIDAMVGAIDMSGALDNIGVEDEVEEGIHDRDITSAPHTNVKGEMGAYDPAKRAASLKRLANFGPEKNDDEIEEGLPKGYFKKATAELDESFEKLVNKLEKQGKSKKAATAIAGAVASYKAKGGGKGPTAKQKAR